MKTMFTFFCLGVFTLYINRCRKSSQKDSSVEDYWSILKGALLETTDRSCRCTKGSARHRETSLSFSYNDDISNSVSEKCKL